MNTKAFLLLLLFWAKTGSTGATNIRLTQVEVENRETFSVRFTIAWDNGWCNARNYDAAWVFLKFQPKNPQYNARPVLAQATGHAFLGKTSPTLPDPVLEVSTDRIGVFVYPSAAHRSQVEWTLRLAFDPKTIGSFDPKQGDWNLYAMEMVYIPEGRFTLGDPDTASLAAAAFYRSGVGGQYDGLFEVKTENQAIAMGRQPGSLCYRAAEPEYQGDGQGILPPEFPKGVQAFYVQKYELSQGEYAAFLSSLGEEVTTTRANFAGRGYAKSRGSITFDGEKYVARSPARPLNFVGWDDGCAYADWAGLRPMTELEFEKACRGLAQPLPHEYPWGTGSKARLARFVDADDELKCAPGLDEGQLSDQTRDVLGASHFWVMDLAGSVWEKVVSVGHPAGRAFRGTHGDGKLAGYGYATNEDWPQGDHNPTAGFGYRGGGYYEHGKPAGDFNPHSPVGWRNYAAWSGGPRSIAYGFRCVRTAKPDASGAQTAPKSSETRIREAIATFSEKVMAGDWDAVAAAYTDDAKIFPGGQPILQGRAAIRGYWATSSKVLFHKITPSELKITGSEAWDWGVYEGRSIGADGKESTWKGKYVIIWKEVSPGDWKMYLDIWNRLPD